MREIGEAERRWLHENVDRFFYGDTIVSKGRVHRPLELPGFVAYEDGEPQGAAIYCIEKDECELVSLDARKQWRGIGTALTHAVEEAARNAGCTRLWLITTNDNVDALRFYQRRGYRLAAVHANAIEKSREIKPQIPRTGNYGIEIRDEIELDKAL